MKCLAPLCTACLLITWGCTTRYIELSPMGNDTGPPRPDGGRDADSDSDTSDYFLQIVPRNVELRTNAALEPATHQLQAFYKQSDGTLLDVTEETLFFLEDNEAATVSSGGLVTATNQAGGVVRVHGTYGEHAATGTVTVYLDAIILATDAPGLPENPERYFSLDFPVVEEGDLCPTIVYPAHETMLPPNVFLIHFQWDADSDFDLFRLTFQGEYSNVDVYTTLDNWLALEDDWLTIGQTNAGSSVTVEVSAVDSGASETTIYTSQSVELLFSRADIRGIVYYWSTESGGVMQASLRRPTPERFYPRPDVGGETCVSCHTISRDGRQMVLGYDGEQLQSIGLEDRSVIIPTGLWEMGWGTFSPDGNRILTAHKGNLRLLNATTGDSIGPDDGEIDLPGKLHATFPDWSPRGDYVAVTVGEKAENKHAEKASIARIPFEGDAWGDHEVLFEPEGEIDNCFFPVYSPDGAWLVFVCALGNSKDQLSSRLYLMDAEGGTPIELTRLNERVGNLDRVFNIGNTMPTWGPSVDPDIQWILFSSVRDYGHFINVEANDQLWVAALDLSSAESGDDPSFAAFWLPLQQISEHNHRAFWTIDPDEDCREGVEICDGIDNNCNGITDEDCVECTEEEICTNHYDDDCDGVINDGCGCDSVEICDNRQDDDCDGLTDEEDEDCYPI